VDIQDLGQMFLAQLIEKEIAIHASLAFAQVHTIVPKSDTTTGPIGIQQRMDGIDRAHSDLGQWG